MSTAPWVPSDNLPDNMSAFAKAVVGPVAGEGPVQAATRIMTPAANGPKESLSTRFDNTRHALQRMTEFQQNGGDIQSVPPELKPEKLREQLVSLGQQELQSMRHLMGNGAVNTDIQNQTKKREALVRAEHIIGTLEIQAGQKPQNTVLHMGLNMSQLQELRQTLPLSGAPPGNRPSNTGSAPK